MKAVHFVQINQNFLLFFFTFIQNIFGKTLHGNLHIHKSKSCNSKPCFKVGLNFLCLLIPLNVLITKKSNYTIIFAETLKLIESKTL